MTSWSFWYLQFSSLFFLIFGAFSNRKGKNNLYHLLGNFTRISKKVLKFCPDLIFMDLWRHNDVMIFLISKIFKPFFQFFVLLLYSKVKMSYAIFLKIFRGFRKRYWNFVKIRFLLDLWRHNDVMIVLIYSIFKPLFQYLVNLTIVKVKMTHTIFLEIFRGFWKWYWNFA